MKVLPLSGDKGPFSHIFFCEGCGCGHGFNVNPAFGEPLWTWNNNPERPTIQPSLLVNVGGANPNAPICHSFVTDGRIQYLSDSTHHLAGQTVELTDV